MKLFFKRAQSRLGQLGVTFTRKHIYKCYMYHALKESKRYINTHSFKLFRDRLHTQFSIKETGYFLICSEVSFTHYEKGLLVGSATLLGGDVVVYPIPLLILIGGHKGKRNNIAKHSGNNSD